MTTAQVLAFAGVVVLGAMSPGPDFAVVVRHAIVSGRMRGMLAGAGVAAGVLLWALVAASGLAALIAFLPGVLTAIKLAGAAYLAYLGVRAVLAARCGAEPQLGAVPKGSAFRDGLICNVLNPKAAVFFVALLPQFLPADGAGLADTLLLSAIAVMITATWFVTVATLAGTLRRLLARPAVRRGIDAVSGAVLIGFGVRLAVTSTR